MKIKLLDWVIEIRKKELDDDYIDLTKKEKK